MRPIRRTLAGALLAVVTVAVSACGAVGGPRITRLPSDGAVATAPASTPPARVPTQTSAPTAPDAAADDCSGRSVTIDSGSVPAALRGTCAEIDVQGNAVQVDAGAATVAVVSLAGDRIAIELGNAGQVVIRGNDAVVTAVEADRLDIRGDRNVVTVSGTLTAVSFQGNDNVVRGTPGDVSDGGARNIVG